MNAALTEEQIKQLPKADLHVHLDGSLRIPTIIELAQERKISLPSNTAEGLREQVFKDVYEDLPDYLKGFSVTCSVMQDAEALERVAYEFAWDCYEEGVLYVEPRYSPELLQEGGLSIGEVIRAIDAGMSRAQKEINAAIAADNGKQRVLHQANAAYIDKPEFKYSHIVCAMRMWDASRSLNMVIEALQAKDQYGLPIAAIDLAGPEAGFPAVDHKEAFIYAHQRFLYKTVHAGEAYGPSSIFQALSQLFADRIGHGFHLFSHAYLHTADEDKAKHYVRDLAQYISERRITLEVCLTSNQQTMPHLRNNLQDHTFRQMLESGISVAICTDNRLVSNTSVTKEMLLAQETFHLSHKQMKKVIMYGIKRSFYPGYYLEKKQYIDQCSKYYDYLAGEWA